MNKPAIKVTVILSIKCSDPDFCIGTINTLNQSFTSFELIVINCYKYGALASLKQKLDDDCITFQDCSNSSYIKTINKAVSQSKGKYIVLLDDKNKMHPDKLEKQYLFMEANEGVDCSNTWVKATGDCSFIIKNKYYGDGLKSTLLLSEPFINSSFMYRKSSLEKHGILRKMYDLSSSPLHKYKLLLKLIRKGFVIKVVPHILSEYNVSISQNTTEENNTTRVKKAKIQAQFMNHINSLIVKRDKSLIDLVNEHIRLYQSGNLNFQELKTRTAKLYQAAYKDVEFCPKKNILICIKDLNSGGAERSLINLLDRLDYDRYNVDLLVLTKYGVYFDNIHKNVNWYTLDNFEKYNLVEYDIEVSFLEGPSTKFIANRVNSAKKIAWVRIDLYTWHWTKYTYRNLEEEIETYKKFDLLLFNSKQTLECFIKRFGEIPVDKKVIYNVIDKQKIVCQSNEYNVQRNDVITLCSAGRLNTEKAYERLLHILNDLKNEGLQFRYWILGEGNLKPILDNLISSFGLENDVFLLGFHKNPYPYIKHCDVFVQTSLAEGFSLVVAEAICLGKPVLATDTAGPTELLDNGNYGFLVKNDYDSICFGLRALIQNEALRTELEHKSVQRSAMFDATGIVQQIMYIFESLLESRC
jgi:glycosyltransferase involved in cell wall biosynthesis